MPITGMLLSYGLYKLVRKHIFEHPQARRRVVILIPYYISFSFSLMAIVAFTKSF
jgi:hypothetical protein